MNYNKHPITILGALKADIRSAGWEVRDAACLTTDRGTRCVLGVDLQNKLGMSTTQKPASKKNRGLMCYSESNRKGKNKSFI